MTKKISLKDRNGNTILYRNDLRKRMGGESEIIELYFERFSFVHCLYLCTSAVEYNKCNSNDV